MHNHIDVEYRNEHQPNRMSIDKMLKIDYWRSWNIDHECMAMYIFQGAQHWKQELWVKRLDDVQEEMEIREQNSL